MLHSDLQHLFPGQPNRRPREGLRHVVSEAVLNGTARCELARQLRECLAERSALGYERFVVGLSGGVDSAVCARLIRDATPGAAHAVIIDLGDADRETSVATNVAKAVEIPYAVLDGRATYHAHREVVEEHRLVSRIHMRSRLINSMVFQFADNCGGFVVDTTDKSEQILRLYEEGRRGHIAPIIGLYKSELYAMAESMGLGRLTASGCPDLNNMDAFGLEWPYLDAVLNGLVNGVSPEVLARTTGLDASWLAKLAWRVGIQPLRTDLVELHADGRSAIASESG